MTSELGSANQSSKGLVRKHGVWFTADGYFYDPDDSYYCQNCGGSMSGHTEQEFLEHQKELP